MISNSRESSLPGPASKKLCSNLARGIHAAAQPLTILLASLSEAHTGGMSIDEFRKLTASSEAQVQRVCTLFSCLQQLVTAESIEPEVSPTPIVPLLAYVAEGVNLLFQQDGMTLSATMPDTCQPVLIDRARTLEALSRVLLVAHAVSGTKDTVELIASFCANGVQIVVRNLNSSIAAMDAEASLSMAVAEANIQSQQADFSWSLHPFNVQIELPKAPSGY